MVSLYSGSFGVRLIGFEKCQLLNAVLLLSETTTLLAHRVGPPSVLLEV